MVRERTGPGIEREVATHAPIAIGAAIVTEAPSLRVRHLIHAPAMETPGVRIGVESIRRATRAGFLAASHYALERVAIPGFGYGELGVSHEEAARAMIDEATGFKKPQPVFLIVLDTDPTMYDALKLQTGGR